MLLFARMLLRRDHWLRSSLVIAIGSAIGAMLLAYLIQWDLDLMTRFVGHFVDLSSPDAEKAALRVLLK